MKSKTGAALLLLVIFLLGGIAGAASFYIYRDHVAAARFQRPRNPGRPDIIEEMARSLNLDSRQKDQLKVIWQRGRERYSALSLAFRPQYEEIRAKTNDAIRAILRPEQRRQFDDTLRKMDSRQDNRPHEGPPPGTGRPIK